MGPLELADYVGLDTNKFIIDGKSFLDLCMLVNLSTTALKKQLKIHLIKLDKLLHFSKRMDNLHYRLIFNPEEKTKFPERAFQK